MKTQAKATFEQKDWDEKLYDEIGKGAKLTCASVTKTFSGDIQGDGKVEYLMHYDQGGSATIVGLERVVGRLGGRSGSFVIVHNATFDKEAAKGTFHIVRGSGTDDLQGLRGEGSFMAKHGPSGTYTFEYDFE